MYCPTQRLSYYQYSHLQKTLNEGIGEAEFLKYFHLKIATPDTIFIGFNNIRLTMSLYDF